MKKGDILSELQFYVVESVTPTEITVKDELGNNITVTKEYAEKLLSSADNFIKEEKVTATRLAEIFLAHTRVAMSVCYRKKDEPKGGKVLVKEKEDLKKKVLSANVNELPKLVDELIENPIQTVIPGEMRVMKGRHYGVMTDLGRINFIDMEIVKDSNPIDNRSRQVDPRTLLYVIVDNVKYILK